MGRLGRGLLGFLGGSIGGYILCMAAYIAWSFISDFNDREGGVGMGVAFFIAPAFGLLCGVAAAVWAARR